MFNPRKPQSVSKSIRMDEVLVNRLQSEADKRGMSLNQIITQCCQYALASLGEDREASRQDTFSNPVSQ